MEPTFDIKILTKFRKELHRHPEVSGQEKETSKRVVEFLKNYQPDQLISELGGHGIAAIYKGKASGKNILIRCELDALPIQEINNFEHASTVRGVSHKCGHDGHMSIIAGLAMSYHQNRPDCGNIILLFQPAEENGEGAKAVLADPRFTSLSIDYAIALHNLPGVAQHQVVLKKGTFTAAVNSIIIQLKGKTAHAGEPENGINPSLAIAELIQAFDQLVVNDSSRQDFFLATPIYTKMGSQSYGISAGSGEVHYTLRSQSNEYQEQKEKEIESLARSIAKQHHLAIEIEWKEQFFANQNDQKLINAIELACRKSAIDYNYQTYPNKWGEDFGLFTEHFAGAMVGLGAGIQLPALHNPDYDFPDEIIETGVRLFYYSAQQLQNVL